MGYFALHLLLWIEHTIRAISKYIAIIIRSTIYFFTPVFTTPHTKYPWSHISTIWPEYRFPHVVMPAWPLQIPLGNLNSSRCLTKAQLDMIRENQIYCHALIPWHTYTHPCHSWCRYSLLRNFWYCHYSLTYESLHLLYQETGSDSYLDPQYSNTIPGSMSKWLTFWVSTALLDKW